MQFLLFHWNLAACKEGIGFGMSAWSSTTMEDLVLNTMTGLKFLNMYMYR